MASRSSAAYGAAIRAAARDATKHVTRTTAAAKNDVTRVGFGSGRAATAVAKEIAGLVRDKGLRIIGVPTSLQIKLVIEEEVGDAIPLIGADQTDAVDIVYDGADQIDARGYVVKGGGGALLRENILFNMAPTVVVMADATKFVRNISRTVPVEAHRLARRLVQRRISEMGGEPVLRVQDSGYPVFTENGNIILDCGFGTILDPGRLTGAIRRIPGVAESGIFARRPDIIYKAGRRGKFREIRARSGRADAYAERDPDLKA